MLGTASPSTRPTASRTAGSRTCPVRHTAEDMLLLELLTFFLSANEVVIPFTQPVLMTPKLFF